MADILIIDDDMVICDILTKMMENIGHNTHYAVTGADGLKQAETGMFDIVFLDVNLPDINGLDLIKTIKQVPSSPEVIIVTGENTPDGAQIAINSGAWNYIEKPFLRQNLTLQVHRALQFRSEKRRIPVTGPLKRNAIVGESSDIKYCIDQICAATYSDVPVLISGESGTGKELFAQTVHLNSDRYTHNFIKLDCSVAEKTILETMLCMDKDGIKSGEIKDKTGWIKQSESGTLFLDKIEKLSVNAQQSLLSVITRKQGRIRVIASTCQEFSLLSRQAAVLFDGFDQSGAIFIKAPALRNIKEDCIKIALSYIDIFCKKYGVPAKGVSPEFIDIIEAFKWPGNVKELVTAVDAAVSCAKNEPTLYSIHLPSYIKSGVIKEILKRNAKDEQAEKKESHVGEFPPLKVFMETSEKQYLSAVLSHVSGNVSKACRISGISSSSMYDRLKKYGLI
ncbi:MAG: sigma 54-interacting transcriptional regulator [Proteobacteria bacterium]|nr:sigma 54-interacting transcriptional regulator [Pseudomonadota bacterium]MBU1387367.1 sigma 54-interacting transcriptional regulator [Pseudomonadota bacterium]MBU1541652.1 sigma 54-interacting transcriptional regulator [Pseudomonadota bacterium]MBU2430645.1 sigma 54-interacting transcriptional regulator [Pseudomonadota bacterium]MBU2482118.1 sigma 54-interacting transcriptional regulator [Pseudomonadota bacterium]